ncbi:VRR-NUC domain-containing protein [Campylobacter sp. CN_NE3]|uniref:VRR-NUC domain-containing protein n=2 Tax=unclassified Campylobacter TaxID=2593542 RepID=UPI0022E9F33B|nr:VRR-NUC domain-containing protein [Campylobacter sp. CN_NE3]MDA3056438.1 VRR-NUC domain-containing protein [Campylobacter sp. CN_NA1]MDA3069371.1 VRR-NUC domain-containing protein [Campylobacter sp. CN_NE3]
MMNLKYRLPTEAEEQLAFISWLRLKNIPFNHTANERKTSVYQGRFLKRMGVARGFPDLTIFLPKKVLYVELKRKTGAKITDEQKKWVTLLDELEYAKAKICYGADEAIKFIQENI